MKKFIFLFLFVSLQVSAYAQYLVKGIVQDSTGVALPGAIVKLKADKDSLLVNADVDGVFSFKGVKASDFTLVVAYIGFKNFVKQYKNETANPVFNIPIIQLSPTSNSLNEVVVTASTPIKIKEDTLEFNAKSFPVREGDAVEEVLKKLPGVTVDKEGRVTTQGKPITRVRVNGKDFFGADVATAIQNLPADIVKNLQVIDDYGDQAKLTGIKTGEPEKVLNINIQEDKKKGYFARGGGGMGNEDRYIANIRGNTFKGERQISADASVNNTNIRSGGDGITSTQNLSLNYRNKWSEVFSADGYYNFNSRQNKTLGTTYRESLFKDFSRIDDQRNTISNENSGQSFGGNLEFTFDTLNYLKLTPNVSFNNSGNQNSGLTNTVQRKISSVRDSRSFGDSRSANGGLNLFYNHKFYKKGRNFSLWSSVNLSKGENEWESQNDYTNMDSTGKITLDYQYQLTDNKNDNFRTVANFSYIEPVSKSGFLELSYNLNRSSISTSRDTRDRDTLGVESQNIGLTNLYEYSFTTHRAGLNYRYIRSKFNYHLGLSTQNALLAGEDLTRSIDIKRSALNLVPSARFVYFFSKQKRVTVNYNGRINQPNFTQLQPITDNSNLQTIVVGNPNLDPEFHHGMNIEFNQSDWNAGYTLFTNVSHNVINDKIVTTRDNVPGDIRQRIGYINTNGFFNTHGNYTFSKPFQNRKYTLTFNGGVHYNNNLAIVNEQRNIAKNLVLEQGFKFRIDLKDIIDAEFNTSYSVNTTNYSLSSSTDRRTNRLNLGLNGRNYFLKDFSLGYDISKNINRGFVNAANANPLIFSVSAEYRFLKGNAGTLRIQGFDLFNENTGVSRDVFDNEIVDRRTNRLARYFLMSFNLRIRKFG